MKKISTLFISSLFSLSLLAFDGSGLSITTINTHTNFKIEVDGKKIFMRGNTASLRHLTEGYHSVRIFRELKRNDFGNRFGQKDQLLYSTSIYSSRNLHTEIFINSSGKVFTETYLVGQDNEWDSDYCDEGYDNRNTGGGWNHNYGNVMNAGEFEMVKEQISKEWFEANRLISVKTIIDKNNLSTQQVKELMYLFTFENNRLEVAKYAFRNTLDKESYRKLNDALTFSSSKDELARFIRESR